MEFKNNVTRLLDSKKVPYQLYTYDYDAGIESAVQVADAIGLPATQVFKTLVVAVDDGFALAVIPVAARLDTKALGKRARMADPADAERITGYVKGGTSVLGGRRRLPVLLDESALGRPTIVLNAGRRGLQMEVAPDDLVRLTGARTLRLVAGHA